MNNPVKSTNIDVSLRITATLDGRDCDPDCFVDVYNAEIVCCVDEVEAPVGCLRFSVVRFAESQSWTPAEMLDGDEVTAEYISLLNDAEGFGYPFYRDDAVSEMATAGAGLNLLTLDSIEVLPAYRGRGIALKALAVVLRRDWGCGLAVMRPFPLQFSSLGKVRANWRKRMRVDLFSRDETEAITTLRRYYGKLGFKRVPGTRIMALGLAFNLEKRWRKAGVFDDLDLDTPDDD